ncbi:MAG TPA: phenylacetate--CoA ligase [Thermodesulfovibrionales bacterium]|jgi:phenylacetate-CoA ligase|nr:phenylacetate--CoA ligase [Thermodesulfovibrionales bacterium]
MIWNKEAECMRIGEREKLQLARMKAILKRTYENVPYYKKRFDEIKFKPGEIKSLEDIRKLPFTTKTDLREGYPFGLFAVPRREIVEVHTSSGTTGKPTVSGYTKKDIEIWGEVVARALTMCGATKDDIIQNGYGYGLFTGGLGVHYGAQRIGATVIPISAGQTKRHLDIMQDFGSTILTCTPSYALYLTEAAEEAGINIKKLKLKAGCFGAEMWTDRMRDEIEKRFHLIALNIYGLTEIIGPGVAQECDQKNGLHIFEDHFYPEVVSPETLEPLPEGEKGELVLTTLTREGMPMIRFRTRDITTLRREICKCGRTLVRMDRITGRTDDMLKIRGVLVFPYQIEKALLEIKGVEPHYQIIVTRPHHLDEIEVQVETSKKLFSDEVRHLEEVRKKIENRIENSIGLRVKVTLVEPKTLPRSEGKAKRVIDKRQL